MAASGNPYEIKIMCNKGNPPEEHQKQYDELHTWMQQDLVNQLNRSGYRAAIINSENEFEAGEGQYLLLVEIVRSPAETTAVM